ncbi:hypothetical protein EYF80_007203 [Liparis tanakae]|uniref:Uncharacterized protein n=1 Tax=Liparis tanakae TaxID=230148 RepID=A0A4Z2IXH6_9TELE|nr:hypothetical protein EYF80_007203 [Liparis tanakae]
METATENTPEEVTPPYILTSGCVSVVDVRGHRVAVGRARGSHSLCGGGLRLAISLRLRPPSTSRAP